MSDTPTGGHDFGGSDPVPKMIGWKPIEPGAMNWLSRFADSSDPDVAKIQSEVAATATNPNLFLRELADDAESRKRDDVMPLPTKWLALAADMLDLASEKFGCHGCNDWAFPRDWSEAERVEFADAVETWNSDGLEEGYPANPPPADYQVMAFLAARLREEAKAE